jgi:hypothetical protein
LALLPSSDTTVVSTVIDKSKTKQGLDVELWA